MRNRAKKEWMRREAKRRMKAVWDQPKPTGWFDRIVGIFTKGNHEK